jgi:hypothetical protein
MDAAAAAPATAAGWRTGAGVSRVLGNIQQQQFSIPHARQAYMAAAESDNSRLPRSFVAQLEFEGVPDSDERDELRSLLLLHHINSLAAQHANGPRNVSGKRFALELVCEPSNVCGLCVHCDGLELPPQLMPSNCSVRRFARSSRCSLFGKAGNNHVQVWVSIRKMLQIC